MIWKDDRTLFEIASKDEVALRKGVQHFSYLWLRYWAVYWCEKLGWLRQVDPRIVETFLRAARLKLDH